MHKSPCGARFITASKVYSAKHLSKVISSVFKLLYNQTENIYKKAKVLSNHNKIWILQNVILNKITKREKAKCFSTYDFKTLYVKLPHNKLLDVLIQLTDFVFQ